MTKTLVLTKGDLNFYNLTSFVFIPDFILNDLLNMSYIFENKLETFFTLNL
jgi:hypothetical protein